MIHWTTAGVVATPTTLQVRISKQSSLSFAIGAKTSTDTLSPLDFHKNLKYFRIELDTPRSTPCHSLTLSGLPHDPTDYFEALQQVPRFNYCTIHLPDATIPWTLLEEYRSLFDRLVLPISPKQSPAIPAWAQTCTQCVLLLTETHVSHTEWLKWLTQIDAQKLILSYPAPMSKHTPLSPDDVRLFLEQSAPQFEQLNIPVLIRGIPPCLLRDSVVSLERITSKTSNRWYVDAEHQCGNARLFFPDLLQFHKDDQCRFCAFGTSCDGFFLEYLESMSIQLNSIDVLDLVQS